MRTNKNGTVALLPSKVTSPLGGVVRVDYRLHRRDGRWKLFDVMFEGMSTVSTLRGTFEAALERDGVDGMIAALEAKNRSYRERAS